MIDTILTSVFGGLGGLLVLVGLASRASRWMYWSAALIAGAAAIAAHTDSFWPMTLLGMLSLWVAFAAVDVMDLGWRLRCSLTASACVLGFLALWPTLPSWSDKIKCPAYIRDHIEFRLVSGLDLRGGLRLVYTVDVDEAIKDKRDHYYEDMRTELARVYDLHKGEEAPGEATFQKLREKVELEAPRRPADTIRLHVKEGADPSKVDERFLSKFRGELGFTRSPDQRSLEFKIRTAVDTQIRERAVGQAREIILRRVDELGLREAAVSTRDEDIIVEVPGEDEKSFASIREIISQTARLEFKLVDDDSDFFEPIYRASKKESWPEGLDFTINTVPVGKDADGAKLKKQRTVAMLKKLPTETISGTLVRFKEWVATLDVPPDREIGYTVQHSGGGEDGLGKDEETGISSLFLKSRAEITGDLIREAAAMPDQSQNAMGKWVVSLTFTDTGGQLFERLTGANVNRRFAIILDGRADSAPVILGRIAGGHGQITMGANDPETQLRDARRLELVLRSGALPAPISPSNEQRIGPSLGRDAITLGIQGALGGIGLVLLFILVYYERAGFIANVAVVMNLFLQLAILASLGASMTLPGIAGLALTVGMAVDNNIIINERIREELGAGKSPRAAVDLGYRRALNAIIDGHVTTIVAGLVLWQYGTGPLKGFAVTLICGVACNIFTGVVVSRLFVDLWVKTLGKGAQLEMG